MKMKVEVHADVPRGVSKEQWCQYVYESVVSCIGMYHPEEPLFDLDRKTVEVHTPRIHILAD
jgi:hypothetical protein